MARPSELVVGTIIGYRYEMKPIDFGVNGYIFKVKGMKISLLLFSAHSSGIWRDIKIVLFIYNKIVLFIYNRA